MQALVEPPATVLPLQTIAMDVAAPVDAEQFKFEPGGSSSAHYLPGDRTWEFLGELAFEFKVPLELGSNEISVIARDADGVEARHDIAVYRHDPG